ncbi:MAG: spore coat protein YlbD [Bacilli bacterium]|nr:spore coat protein YlbD [Bacilli bacterium]
MSKEEFKSFVRKNPSLIKYVNNNSMTWQKFYEMYDMYGESNDIWNNYLGTTSNNIVKANTLSSSENAFRELVNTVKTINLEKVQKGINSLQKTISLVQELGSSNNTTPKEYERRPIYKHFED